MIDRIVAERRLGLGPGRLRARRTRSASRARDLHAATAAARRRLDDAPG